MAKFVRYKNIIRGTNARKPIEVRFLGVDDPVAIALVPLLFESEADAVKGAIAFAKSKGAENPKPGDALYEQGLMLHTILLSCVDVDSPIDKPEMFFSDEMEIRSSMDPERVALIFHQQRAWQDECSPSPRGMQPEDFAKIFLQIQAAGEGEEIPFAYLPRATQDRFIRTLVALCVNALQVNSLIGSLSPDAIKSFVSSVAASEASLEKKTMETEEEPKTPSDSAPTESEENDREGEADS